MLVTLNAEWLAWTVKMLSKVFFHDQKMIGQEGDKTNIPQNPTKSRTTRRCGEMTIKGRVGHQKKEI